MKLKTESLNSAEAAWRLTSPFETFPRFALTNRKSGAGPIPARRQSNT